MLCFSFGKIDKLKALLGKVSILGPSVLVLIISDIIAQLFVPSVSSSTCVSTGHEC